MYKNKRGGSSKCAEFHGQPIKCNANKEDDVECVYTAAKVKGKIGQCRKSTAADHEEAKEKARRRLGLEDKFQKDALERVRSARSKTKVMKLRKVVDSATKQKSQDDINKLRDILQEEIKATEDKRLEYEALSEQARASQNRFEQYNKELKKKISSLALDTECWFKTPGEIDGRGNPQCGFAGKNKCSWDRNIKRCKPENNNPTVGIKQLYRELQYINTHIELLDDKASKWNKVEMGTSFDRLLKIVGEAVNYWETLLHKLSGKEKKIQKQEIKKVDGDIQNIMTTQDKTDIVRSELTGIMATQYVNKYADSTIDNKLLVQTNDSTNEGVLGKINNDLVNSIIDNIVAKNQTKSIPELKLLILKTAHSYSQSDKSENAKTTRNKLVRFYNLLCRKYKYCNDQMTLEKKIVDVKYKSDGECVVNSKQVRRTKKDCLDVAARGCLWDGQQCRLKK
tara:strand:+ start:8206 stop:9564 length:1359 start_codon:yes stop_codon:yes gene_type:complete